MMNVRFDLEFKDLEWIVIARQNFYNLFWIIQVFSVTFVLSSYLSYVNLEIWYSHMLVDNIIMSGFYTDVSIIFFKIIYFIFTCKYLFI